MIADIMQAPICDIGSCDFRSSAVRGEMARELPKPVTADLVRAWIKQEGLTIRQFADKVGMSENHLTKSLGRAARQFKPEEVDAIRREMAPPELDDVEPIRRIPLYGEVPAGSMKRVEQQAGRWFPVSDPETPPRAYALTVRGDSMDLVADEGTTLVIDPDDDDLWPGERYIVQTSDGDATFKEFQADPARLIPLSSNPEHREIMLGKEPIKILGRVFSYTTRSRPRRQR